jgi:hypothetical protein
MLALRKLCLTLHCAMACSQPAAAPPKPPTSASPEVRQTSQKVMITSQDLKPIDPKRFLYVFPIEPSEQVAQLIKRNEAPLVATDTQGWCLRLNLRQLERTERREFIHRLGVHDGHKQFVEMTWPATPVQDKPTPKDTASSFVIDYDDPRFARLWSEVVKKHGEHPEVAALLDIVAQHINVKTTTRMFDTAAEVAKSRQGDCTEHAALLTALLRRSGRPARLVTGLAVLVDGQEVGAFGHAWTEVYAEGAWRVADAALHPIPGNDSHRIRAIRYIPAVRMIDEGAGFSAALDNVRSIEAIRSVRVETCGSQTN